MNLYSQNQDFIPFYSSGRIIQLDDISLIDSDSIHSEFQNLIYIANNNFKDQAGNYDFFMKEIKLLNSLCHYSLSINNLDNLWYLRNKHFELYKIEEERRRLYLQQNPTTRVKFKGNYHVIYQFIEKYVIPCITDDINKDILYNCYGKLYFLTNEEYDYYIKKGKSKVECPLIN